MFKICFHITQRYCVFIHSKIYLLQVELVHIKDIVSCNLVKGIIRKDSQINYKLLKDQVLYVKIYIKITKKKGKIPNTPKPNQTTIIPIIIFRIYYM